ncbi:MAG: phosphoglycerate dehydrogenase [Parvularculaceae bacterium]
MPKILISDKLSPTAVEIFKTRGLDVTYEPDLGKDKEKLLSVIGDYDGLAIRSATKATEKLIRAATNLKVIGRAGIGVDNIDIKAATAKGIVVMNTPFGNAITTAEHAIAMMFSVARQIPQASESTHKGEWAKSRFMGTELTAKTLGLIGCGNIGSIVATRALGLKMKVVAYDPFLTPSRAEEIGVEKIDLDQLLSRADFITLHTPLTDQTRNILSQENIAKTKKGVRIVNCARGGLIDEEALKYALDSGQVAAAALDVFAVEPAKENPLFGHPNVVCTPHLGAATTEAQENVALQVAEQMSDYLLTGAVTNALNMPSVSATEAPKLKPYLNLAALLGSFAGQLTATGLKEIEIIYAGAVAGLNIKPLTATTVAGVLQPMLQGVNIVNAPAIAQERGIKIVETVTDTAEDFVSTIELRIVTEQRSRAVKGALFGGTPRIISVKGVEIEAAFTEQMLYVTNDDKPGFIGALGGLLGEAGINIATFHLGRNDKGGAMTLVAVDNPVREETLAKIQALPHVKQAMPLVFDV